MDPDKLTEIAVSAGIFKTMGAKEGLAGILILTSAGDLDVAILKYIGLSPCDCCKSGASISEIGPAYQIENQVSLKFN